MGGGEGRGGATAGLRGGEPYGVHRDKQATNARWGWGRRLLELISRAPHDGGVPLFARELLQRRGDGLGCRPHMHLSAQMRSSALDSYRRPRAQPTSTAASATQKLEFATSMGHESGHLH